MIVFLLALIGAPPALAGGLTIADAWTPEAPPGRTMAGFMTLHNTGDQAISLTAARSPQFGRVEIHTMSMDDGVMRMRRLDRLVIDPGATVRLEPGGLHLMLFEPRNRLAVGDAIAITLIGADGQSHELTSTIQPRSR